MSIIKKDVIICDSDLVNDSINKYLAELQMCKKALIKYIYTKFLLNAYIKSQTGTDIYIVCLQYFNSYSTSASNV